MDELEEDDDETDPMELSDACWDCRLASADSMFANSVSRTDFCCASRVLSCVICAVKPWDSAASSDSALVTVPLTGPINCVSTESILYATPELTVVLDPLEVW